MKIGIDCRFYSSNFTGIGRYTHELVSNIIDLNNKFKNPHEIVLFFNKPEFENFKPQKNVKKVLVNAKHYSLKEQTKFLRILNQEKCDLVHFPHFNIPLLYRKPYIVTIHDLTLSFFPGNKMNKWYHRLAYHIVIRNAVRTAKKVITVSKNTKKDLKNMLNVPEAKIEVVYLGINKEFCLLENLKPTKQTLKKYKIKKPFLLYTGVWRSHKNLLGLIRAFRIVKKSLDLQLVITGKPDPKYPEVISAIKKLPHSKDVILTGFVDEKELIHLYNAAMFFVFPSFYEGFGLPPLESMKCGTPVIASNHGSIPEICGKDNAIFFNPHSESDIAQKIEMLYKNAELQTKLIDRGLNHAAKFSWREMAKKTFKIMNECLNHSKNS